MKSSEYYQTNHIRLYEFLARKEREYGAKWDPSKLAEKFGPAFSSGERIRVEWAITRLGNKGTYSVDEMRLLNSVRDRLYTYWCDAGEGCEFLAADDCAAIQWIDETFTGSPSDYVIERVTRTETRRRVTT